MASPTNIYIASRMGLSTAKAITAATMLSADAIRKTPACAEPIRVRLRA
jgi:hypothetical protein